MKISRWLAVAVALSLVGPARAQDEWVGKRVILKKPGIQIGYSDDSGKQIYVAELTNLSYSVLADNQGFLRVTHRGVSGWFPKTDALLPDEAIPFFGERARLAAPKDSYPFAYLGWAHREKRQFDLAIAAYDAAIKRDPRADWYNNRGILHLDIKKLDLAIADFSEAIKRAPKFVLALENRAATYGLQNKAKLALDDWDEVLRLDPGNAPARVRRAKIYIDQKQLDKAVADLSAILKDDPKNIPVLIDRGQLYVDLNKADEALSDFSAALALDATNAETYLARAQVFTDKKEFGKALLDAEEAVRLAPTLSEARVARGWNQFLKGDFEKANEDFAKAVEMNPNLPGAYNSQAWLWATCPDKKFRSGQKAVEFAAKALKLTQGKEPTILDTQAAALAENGDFDQAVRVQEQVVRAVANTPLAAEAQTRLELYQKKQPHRQAIAK